VNKPTLSRKLRENNKAYPSSIVVVLLVVFITITVFLLLFAVKTIFFSKEKKDSNNTAPIESSPKELEEVKIKNQDNKTSSYTVESGDTLYSIGIKLGVDWQEISKENNLKEPYTLTVGQKLKMPVSKK